MTFKMGSLDHVHIRVPDRDEAARWYAEHLGFEPVQEYDFWATGIDFGPLQMSADGGRTMIALFEASEGHPLAPMKTGVAFTVDVPTFIDFSRSIDDGALMTEHGRPLQRDDLVDLDLCWAYGFADPWGNVYELNCYDYDAIQSDLVEADGLQPTRYWPKPDSM